MQSSYFALYPAPGLINKLSHFESLKASSVRYDCLDQRFLNLFFLKENSYCIPKTRRYMGTLDIRMEICVAAEFPPKIQSCKNEKTNVIFYCVLFHFLKKYDY